MIADDRGLEAARERIRLFQTQVARMRKTESKPANHPLSAAEFLTDKGRMQVGC